MDKGIAYGMNRQETIDEFCKVASGTAMGELLRRYWQPIGLTEDATETPKKIKALGEDLILFRDKKGRPGLVHPNCAHRGTSLYYGKVEEEGIRCCYHGWLFDVQGNCVDQPCEPNGGKFKNKIRQPWYPVEEKYGLIWAYMGPAEKKPILPSYEALDNLEPGEFVEADDSSIGGGGPQIIDCNWFQHYENLVDPFHVVVLHSTFSGTQFIDDMALLPDVKWETTELGVKTISIRALENGKVFRRVSQAGVPNMRVIPSPRVGKYGRVESLAWILPIDDKSFRIFLAGRVTEKGQFKKMRSRQGGKLWHELTEEEHQKYPGDYEAMVSQGIYANRSEEHLATTDKGIVMLRRYILNEMEKVKNGQDPAGVSFDPEKSQIYFDAGNYLLNADE